MKHRLEHIDGLRGLAAVVVLYQHMAEYWAALSPGASLATRQLDVLFGYMDIGKLGVVAFFAISGYIVPFSFDAQRPRLSFVVSRIFRLYPAYWLSLALAVVLLPLIGHAEFGGRQIAANATMVQTALRQKDVLDVYWTLLIEVTFYAMCFGVFSAGLLRKPRAVFWIFCAMLASAVVGAVARDRGHAGIPAALPLYLAVMWFGACTRLATLERDDLARRLCRPMLALLLVAIPFVWFTAYDAGAHKESLLADVTAFYAALAVFLFCVHRRAFASRSWIYLGSISYSLYLLHPIALELATYWTKHVDWPMRAAVHAFVTLVLSLLGAHLMSRHVERPAVRLGKRMVPALLALRRDARNVAAP